MHDCPATPILARELAVVQGLAVISIQIMVLAARVQLSRPGGQGVGCSQGAGCGPYRNHGSRLGAGFIETMVLAARVQLSRPGGQGVGCS